MHMTDMKTAKQMMEDITHVMVIPTLDNADETTSWLNKQLKQLNPVALHGLHALSGAALASVADNELDFEHDDRSLIFHFLQGQMLELLCRNSTAGTKDNPLQCGLWLNPMCDKCEADGKKEVPCPVELFAPIAA